MIERLVDTGQTVRRGQPLMRIDAADYALAQAAQDQLVAAAKARAVQAERRRARYRDLVGAGAVSGSTYDQIKAAALAARAQLQAAEAQARVSRNTAGYAVLVADADGVVVETLASPARSSPPARRSCAWPMPARARPRSPCPRPCARRSARRRPPRCSTEATPTAAPRACARFPTPPIPAPAPTRPAMC
jgi:pyruvate/2-oxoglutarate dehydrogenase complex dihydrolipoamide acyltransferase (E2) component